MKNLRAVLLMTGTAILATLAVGTAFAATTVAFKGTYAGTVTEKVDGQAVTALANGAGAGTVIGKGKLFGTVAATTANPPCSPISGPGTLSGPAGKLKLSVLPTSHGCAASEDDQNNISVSGVAKVTGGTLKFKKARGTLRFSGHYDRGTGAFNVKLTGSLTY
jgi:hypothetical protein